MRIEGIGSRGFKDCIAIYREAFFQDESISVSQIEKLIKTEQAKLFSLSIRKKVVAFAFLVTAKKEKFAWLDYFATRKNVRGKGIGTKLLLNLISVLKRHSPAIEALFLEVGDDEHEIGKQGRGWQRRVQFYSKCGACKLEDVTYLFPGYGRKGPIPMSLMAFPLKSQKRFSREFVKRVIVHVYRTIHSRGPRDRTLRAILAKLPVTIELTVPKTKEWVVYMVETKSGKLYTGITTDLLRRWKEHSSGKRGAKYFRLDSPTKIVFQEQVKSRSLALKREYEIKRLSRRAKQNLI